MVFALSPFDEVPPTGDGKTAGRTRGRGFSLFPGRTLSRDASESVSGDVHSAHLPDAECVNMVNITDTCAEMAQERE